MNYKELSKVMDENKVLRRTLFMRALPDVDKALEIAKGSDPYEDGIEVVGTDVIIYYEDSAQEKRALSLAKKKGIKAERMPVKPYGYHWGDPVFHLDPNYSHLTVSEKDKRDLKKDLLDGKEIHFPETWFYEDRVQFLKEVRADLEKSGNKQKLVERKVDNPDKVWGGYNIYSIKDN